MPPDDRATKVADRCATHPGRPKVASCDRCGRALCSVCAVPVRGVAYGPECLGEVLGDQAPVVVPPRPARSPLDRGAGIALLAILASTLAPWTRFGTGSGWLHGAWSLDLRWSMTAAIPAAAGIAVWLVAGVRRPALARGAAIVGGTLAALGSLMAFLNPPPFTRAAVAPWVAMASGAAAVAFAVAASREGPGPSV